jgi:pimeloyl-ACP methyl ester carboxylesterase
MDKVTRDSVTLSARSVESQAPDGGLLLVHGLNANMAFWHPVLVRKLAARRVVVMYDQRGHGRSDMPPSGYTSSELARDAAVVLDAYGMDRADVVAHSFGCTVALQLARLCPKRVRSLVLLDARLRMFQPVLKLADWPDFERWKASLGVAGEQLDPAIGFDFMLPLYLVDGAVRQASPDLVANGFAPMGGGRRGAARYRRLIGETTAPIDFPNPDGLDLQSLRSLSCRLRAIYGSRSPFLETLNALQRELPGCDTHVIAQGGHNFPVVYPDHTADLILEFLANRPDAVEHAADQVAAHTAPPRRALMTSADD